MAGRAVRARRSGPAPTAPPTPPPNWPGTAWPSAAMRGAQTCRRTSWDAQDARDAPQAEAAPRGAPFAQGCALILGACDVERVCGAGSCARPLAGAVRSAGRIAGRRAQGFAGRPSGRPVERPDRHTTGRAARGDTRPPMPTPAVRRCRPKGDGKSVCAIPDPTRAPMRVPWRARVCAGATPTRPPHAVPAHHHRPARRRPAPARRNGTP